MHEETADPALTLPGELLLAGPVAAEPDLHVAARVDEHSVLEPVHRRPVRELDAEDLGARVRMRVEVDEADRAARRAGADIRLGDRVVAPEDDGQDAHGDDLGDGLLDRLLGGDCVGWENGRVAEVHDPELLERIDAGLEMRPRRAARCADRARPVAGAGPVGDEVVGGRPHDGDVRSGELGRILRVGLSSIREEAGEVGLFAVAPPASEGVEHGAILSVCESPARVSAALQTDSRGVR